MNSIYSIKNDIKTLWRSNGVLLLLLFFLLYSSLYIYHIYFRLLFALIALFVIPIRKSWDNAAVAILWFSLSYAFGLYVNNKINGAADYVGYMICPLLFYLFGKKIVRVSSSNNELTTFLLISIFLFGLKVYISTISDLSHGITISLSRTDEIDNTISATLQSATLSLGLIGLSTFWVFKKPFRNIKAWCFAIIFALSIVSITHYVSRTGLVIFIICTILVIAYKTKMQFSKFLLLLGVASIIVWLLSSLDFFQEDIFNAYMDRQDDLDKSMGEDGGRMYRWRHALGMMITHPIGWSTTEYEYVHNFWLDVDMYAGLIPFVFLIICTSFAIKNQLVLLKLKDNSFVAISFGIQICMFMTSFVEPILQGYATYVYFMFLIWGMQSQYLMTYKRLDTNE